MRRKTEKDLEITNGINHLCTACKHSQGGDRAHPW